MLFLINHILHIHFCVISYKKDLSISKIISPYLGNKSVSNCMTGIYMKIHLYVKFYVLVPELKWLQYLFHTQTLRHTDFLSILFISCSGHPKGTDSSHTGSRTLSGFQCFLFIYVQKSIYLQLKIKSSFIKLHNILKM